MPIQIITPTLPNPETHAQSNGAPPAYDGMPWPESLDGDALSGLAGDVVRLIEPHSEADPAALLVQFLIAFGNAAGRAACWMAEDTPHFTNEFAVIVGDTSVARKGTSLDRVLNLFDDADLFWRKNKIASGLVSGEGLIFSIRDARDDSEGKCVDEGVPDKRLLVTEGEFAQVLATAGRRDSTLSAILRLSWDSRTLRTLAKNSGKGGEAATHPHVSIIAHITAPELQMKLAKCDTSNGFANRFLWVCARRSKLLPHGGRLPKSDYQTLIKRVSSALAWAKNRTEMEFTDDAISQWESAYRELSQGHPGTLGNATSRATAHVRRLALIYALLDEAETVDTQHLKAARAVWSYCHTSAESIFGGLSVKAQDIYEYLRLDFPGEIARTELRAAAGRNIPAPDFSKALTELEHTKLATSRKEPTGGAPRELWRAVLNK